MANGYRDPAEIEREIHETQARMSQTLDAIQEKLQPRRMMDQVSSMFRSSKSGGYGHRASDMGDTLRDNALPLAMIGLGLGWLVWSNTSHPQTDAQMRRARYWASRRASDLRHRAEAGYERLRGEEGRRHAERHEESFGYGTGASYGGTAEASAGAGTVPDRYRNDMGMAYGTEDYAYPGEYRYRAAERESGDRSHEGRHYTDRMREGMRSASHSARHYSRRARQGYNSLWHTIEDHPLMSGLFGFFIGAAVGAAIPSSRYEDEWLGDYRDAMVERGREYGSDAVERASNVAVHAAEAGYEAARDAAREEAERQGLTPEQAGQAAREELHRTEGGTKR